MQIIGITGVSGAGKTTVAKEICDIYEAEHINADKIARECQKKGEPYYKKIVEAFGEEMLLKDRRIRQNKTC